MLSNPWAENHQPPLSHFSLLEEFFIGKNPVYNKDSRVLRMVNLIPNILNLSGLCPVKMQALKIYLIKSDQYWSVNVWWRHEEGEQSDERSEEDEK